MAGFRRLTSEKISVFAQSIYPLSTNTAQKISLETSKILEIAYQKDPTFFSGRTSGGLIGSLFFLLGLRYGYPLRLREIAEKVELTAFCLRENRQRWLGNFPYLFEEFSFTPGRYDLLFKGLSVECFTKFSFYKQGQLALHASNAV